MNLNYVRSWRRLLPMWRGRLHFVQRGDLRRVALSVMLAGQEDCLKSGLRYPGLKLVPPYLKAGRATEQGLTLILLIDWGG